MSSTITEEVKESTKEIVQEIAEGKVDSTDSSARYLGYFGRLKPLLIATSRYVAYTSDVGEAFRPVAHPYLITAAYGISWAYLAGDVAYEGYKSKYIRNQDTASTSVLMVKRSIFQATASMALPAFTIHSVVRYAGRAFKNVKNNRLRVWGPTFAGLSVVPALPFIFDHPVEYVVDKIFEKAEDMVGMLKERDIANEPVRVDSVDNDLFNKKTQ